VRYTRWFSALAVALVAAFPAQAWHGRVMVVAPVAVAPVATAGAGPVYATSAAYLAPATLATYAPPATLATYATAPVAAAFVAPAPVSYQLAAPVSYQLASAPVSYQLASAPVTAAAPLAAAAAPCAASVTDREIGARLDRVGAAFGGGGRLTAVQPMSNAQLTERLAQLAATVEALAQVVDQHGQKLRGK
jgi:hypothetical protein